MSELVLAPDLKIYKGNCHCAAFKFSIQIPELTSVTECNCSICFKKGYKWIFPSDGSLVVENGKGSLTSYKFGKRQLVHKVLVRFLLRKGMATQKANETGT